MLFDVYDLDTKKLYNYYEFIKFCNDYGFEHCPIIDDNFKLLPTVQEMLAYSNGLSKHAPVLREGVVIRRKDNFHESVKVRSPEYLTTLGK
jgi:ATP-dependent RNA circularization protein (DNA/RNA ligase family)